MGTVPKHLEGAPKLLSRFNGYKISRTRTIGIGKLLYTFECLTCGYSFSRKVDKDYDYRKEGVCARHSQETYESILKYQAFVSILKATQRRLIKESIGHRISIDIVRPKDFIKFVSDTMVRFGYVVDPQDIKLYVGDDGFITSNLHFIKPRIPTWGDVEDLVNGINKAVNNE